MSDKIMYECFMCQNPFQFGPHRYDGKPIKGWDMMVCLACVRANHDGIVPAANPRLISHLSERGIAIVENAKGWIDWPL